MQMIITETNIIYEFKYESERSNRLFYIGIDIGTTSTKTITFDKAGNIISKSTREYPIYSPQPDFREQDPEEILKAVVETLEESIMKAGIGAEEISFIAFSSMMHSIIAVGENCKPLTKCIIWSDNRSASYAHRFKDSGKGREIYLKTGTPTHPMSPLYKLMWLKDNEAEIYSKAYKFISIKEYILYKFFKRYIVDYSVASSSGMFNIFNLKWDKEVLDMLELDEAKLPEAVPTTCILQNLDEEICARTGLTAETKFVIGASDGCLASLGSNAVELGIAAATIGTSGAVRIVSKRPVTDDNERFFCYYLSPDRYVVGGAINNGAVVYRWYRDEFTQAEKNEAEKLGAEIHDLLNDKIAKINAGSEGLLFLPFLSGERAPYWDAELRGAYLGIADYHNRIHFARALMEGICYDMKEILDAVKDLSGPVNSVYANGGFTRSQEWVQILCDIFGVEVILTETYESSSLGAVMLGMYATREIDDLKQCSDIVKVKKVIKPRAENICIYEELYKLYREAIERLMPVLKQLSCYKSQ